MSLMSKVVGSFVGLLFLLFSFTFLSKYRKVGSFVKYQGTVLSAWILRMGSKGGYRINFVVSYEFQGRSYQGGPVLFQYPAFRGAGHAYQAEK